MNVYTQCLVVTIVCALAVAAPGYAQQEIKSSPAQSAPAAKAAVPATAAASAAAPAAAPMSLQAIQDLLAPEQAISIDLQDAFLKDVLKIFSVQSGLNFIASDAIQDKKITLYLDKVPIKQAMDKLFETNKLIYEFDEEANMFVVRGKEDESELITRVFQLKYRSVASSNMEQQRVGLFGGTKSGGGSSDKNNNIDNTIAKISDITKTVEQVLSKQGKVSEDNKTNSLIVTDIASRFPMIRQVIASLDVRQPQVMLEIEMLDVSKDIVDNLGLKFGQSPFNLTMIWGTKGTNFPFTHNLGGTNPNQIGSMSWSDSQNPYSMLFDFLKTKTDTKFLARPRILALNNETAEISVTKDEVVTKRVVWVQDTDSSGHTEDVYDRATSLELTPEGIGVFLRVTPMINTDTGEITMVVFPKTSSAVQSPYVTDGTLALDPEVRSTKSVIKVRDGETVIMGGLIHQDKQKVSTKVPVFSDIPILGMLFRHKQIPVNKDRELLVFITPHILKDESALPVKQTFNKRKPQGGRMSQAQGGEKVTLFTRHEAVNTALNNLE